MEIKATSGIMLTLLLVSMCTMAFAVQSVTAAPRTWIVDDDGPADFRTIQPAVNVANDGDVVLVRKGTYHENVAVDKIISLIGEGRNNTIVSGYYQYKGSVVSVTVDDVRVSGFTIQGGWCGIAVYSSNGCIISENRIMNNFYRGGGPSIYESGRGVWLNNARNCTVANNMVNNNDRNVSLKDANNNTVMNNTVLSSLVSWGIVLESSHNNTISKNIVKYSTYDGIYLAFARNNQIGSNFVIGNGDEGIYIGSSDNNDVEENVVTNNAGEGIWIDGSNNNRVVGNNLMWNGKRGILVSYSANAEVYGNNFVRNSWGQAYSNLVNTWDDGYPSGGNYWSDYSGVDFSSGPYQNETGSDGIGDTPYIVESDNRDHYPLMKPHAYAIWNPCDINYDLKVDIKDLAIAALAYGSLPGHPHWNSMVDLTGPDYLVPDGKIDIRDLALIAKNFGKTYS